MMNRSILVTGIAAALLTCGIGLGGGVSPASTAAAATLRSPAAGPTTPAALQLHPQVTWCHFVACASDNDCFISSLCHFNTCSNEDGNAFGTCTVPPQ